MGWDTYRPVGELPPGIKKEFLRQAIYLLHDLDTNRLKVVLMPAPDPRHSGHMIRVAENHNPAWYSELYKTNPNFRRDLSTDSLERIVRGCDREYADGRGAHSSRPYKYDWRYRGLIFDRLMTGYPLDGEEMPPRRKVFTYFLLTNGLNWRMLEKALEAGKIPSIFRHLPRQDLRKALNRYIHPHEEDLADEDEPEEDDGGNGKAKVKVGSRIRHRAEDTGQSAVYCAGEEDVPYPEDSAF